MKMCRFMTSSALRSSLIIGLGLAASSPAFAQGSAAAPQGSLQTETEIESGVDADEGEAIIVTGSRIRGTNLDSPVPVTAIGGEEFFQQGQFNIGETLNELPALRSTFSQQNPGLGIGIAGLNLLDLRGLGTLRTLVLVNGRRHVGADILNNATSVDVNTIPGDLIERVDVVTGGNSAVYGSDAIAGVVNFILRRDFDGIQIRGGTSFTEEGFGGSQFAALMTGINFGDGRGNVTAHVEFSHQDRIFASDIDSFRRQDGFLTVDADTGGLLNNSDGFPDRAFFRDIRTASINRYGLVPIVQPAGTGALCGTGIGPTNGSPGPGTAGLPYNCTYIFNAQGRLVPQTGTRVGAGIIGSIVGGNGQTGRENQILSILPFQERVNTNLLAHYTFDDALEAFIEAKAVRVTSQGSNFGPSFVQGTGGTLDSRERTRLDNPYLNPADRTTIANLILASGFNTDLQTRRALTAADRAAIANGSYRFVNSRLLTDAGNRDERFQRDTLRVVGGLRGTFNTDWTYELSANYGITKERTQAFGFIDRQRAALAFDAGINPATGQIQCRAQFDPAAAFAYQSGTNTAEQNANLRARLAADIAACVPYNPFGASNNAASVAYFNADYTNNASLDQLVFAGFVSGDLSQLFELPAGPIGFAIGAEYRREKLEFRQSQYVLGGSTNAVQIPDILPDPFEVKEAYAEVRVPLLSDVFLFDELSLSGAARVADYTGGTGTVYAYNAGAVWAPVQDIRFRANYGRSVRAPNVSETASPLIANFAPGFTDPCSPNAINSGTINRAANCAADLGALLAGIPNRTYSLPIVSGSNPNLEAETSDSYTVGAVIQPRFLPGFSLAIDYYDITLNGQIASVSAQGIVNACYDQASLNNPFCSAFERYRGTGTGPNAETPGDVLANSLIVAPLNFASRIRRGIDFEAAYRGDITDTLRLGTRMIYTHQLQNSNFENATDPNFENRILSELGDPEDEFRWNVDLTLDRRVTLGYQMRYIGPMLLTTYEATNDLQGRPAGDADFADTREYPAVVYHNLRFDVRVGEIDGEDNGTNFFVGVDNLTDQDPPLGTTATGAGSAIYAIRGRNYYAGIRASF